MKKLLKLVGILSIIASMTTSVFAQNPSVYVDGVKLLFDVEPFIENDRTLVPMRGIFEAMGATVAWEQSTKTVIATRKFNEVEKLVVLQIGNTRAFIDEKPTELDVAAKIVNNRTFVPVRFVGESLGVDVDWNEEDRTVIITSNF